MIVCKRGIAVWALSAAVWVISGSVYALDGADVVREWTPEGKKLAAERVKLPAHDEMVRIPAGEFLMGSDRKVDKNSYLAEFPQRKVYLDAYDIDKYEVTTVQFLKYVLAHDLGPLIDWQYDGGNFQETMVSHPVMHVSWFDAEAYCKWAGKRLPTEAEWEKAARGGLVQTLFPWGDEDATPAHCHFGQVTSELPATAAVGSYPPNAYGLYDMCGNVWNWCEDYFGTYILTDSYNPKGAENGITRVRRGASFNIIQTFRLRTSNRGAYKPEDYAINIGFRCAKNV